MRGILRSYCRYYNEIRTHRSLDKDAPLRRPIQSVGTIRSRAIGTHRGTRISVPGMKAVHVIQRCAETIGWNFRVLMGWLRVISRCGFWRELSLLGWLLARRFYCLAIGLRLGRLLEVRLRL